MATGSYDAMIQLGIDATKALNDLTTQLQTTSTTLEKSLTTSAQKGGKSLQQETSKGMQKGMQEGSKKGTTYFQQITKQIQNRLNLTIAQGLINAYRRAFRDIYENMKTLNAAQTEFKKVSDYSGASLDAYTDKAAKMGREVGRTGSEMINAATEFKKAGYEEKDSLTLALVATKFQNIADAEISAADAAKFINSQMKAFGISANEAESIIDKVNETANHFAFGTDDMQKALTLSSSSMKGFGNSIEETIAILGAGMEMMPNKASQIGRAWNTIGANIMNMSKTQDTWTSSSGKASVALRDENGQLKSTYQILADLYPQWVKLGEEEKNAMALSVAGKNHLNKFKATMDNFGQATGATTDGMGIWETAIKASGSATRENQKYQESLAFALQNLNAAWENFTTDLIKTGALTKLIKLLTKIVDIFDGLANTIGGIPTLFIAMATSMAAAAGALRLLNAPMALFGKLSAGSAATGAAAAGAATTGAAATEAAAAGAAASGAAASGGAASIGLIQRYKNALTDYNTRKAESLAAAQKNVKGKAWHANKMAEQRNKAYGKLMSSADEAAEAGAYGTYSLANPEYSKTLADYENKSIRATKATQNLSAAEAELATAQNVAVPTILQVTGALIGVGAAIAAIAGLSWVGKKIDEEFGFESTAKKVKKYSSELDEVTSKIDVLTKKKNDGTLTSQEAEELELLEAEKDVLEDQIKLYEKRARKAASRKITGDGTKADESKSDNGLLYTTTKSELKTEQNKLDTLTQQRSELRKLRDQYEEGSKDWAYYDEQIKSTNALYQTQKNKVDELKVKNREYRKAALEDWKKMREEYSDYYKWLTPLAKAEYDNTHKYALLARNDIKDSVANAAGGAIDLFGSRTFDSFDIDLTKIQNANELLETLKNHIKELPENKKFKIYARDEAGNIIDEITLKTKDLSEEEWNVVLNYALGMDGSSERLKEWIDEHPNGTVAELFADINFTTTGEVEVQQTEDDLTGDKTVQIRFNPITGQLETVYSTIEQTEPVQDVNMHPQTTQLNTLKQSLLNNPLKQYVNIIPKNTPHATGKRKGEQGGPSWLGDEGSSKVSFGI